MSLWLPNVMHFVSFHMNRAERSGGAKVFAGTTADAFILVHGGYFHRAVRAFKVHHLDGSRRAMTGTVAARNAVSQDHAIVLNPHSMADMDGGLFLTKNRLDGTSWTNLAATCAFRTAIATLERHNRLHKMLQVR